MNKPAPRCPACQLQLCKSRSQPPHAALKEISHGAIGEEAKYSCEKCGTVLTRSLDLARPGWSQQK